MPEHQPARRHRTAADDLPPPPPPAEPAPVVFREAVVPRDSGTQQTLAGEVDDWWRGLPLSTKLGVHLALTHGVHLALTQVQP